jgi:UDP-glucose 4-epimerase
LLDAGHRVVVVDDLSTGHRWAVDQRATLQVGSVGDRPFLDQVIAAHGVGAVLHFAAATVVPESVAQPLRYYRNNTAGSLSLLEACRHAGIGRFIFSSTAAVYGAAGGERVSEDAATVPINPYGQSKLMCEQMLADTHHAVGGDFRYVALRYFNVAGARLDGELGQATPRATHLVKVACEAACGRRPSVTVFGTDFETADGTGVRDYIHVEDLVRAHLDALAYLDGGGEPVTLNCGYGRGYSVREVLATVRQLSGVNFPIEEGPRRPGDPAAIVADASRIGPVLGWRPLHAELATICQTAYEWECRGLPGRAVE